MEKITEAAEIIKNSKYLTAFTGAGISVESGIPPFRGKNGLWSKFDPSLLDITHFYSHPAESWDLLKQIFYGSYIKAKPNYAHIALANFEKNGILKWIITQNIDNLHYKAGNRNIIEYHGTLRTLTCIKCGKVYEISDEILQMNPPKCECGGILKPDIVFFGEPIPEKAILGVEKALAYTDVMLVIGTTGEIYPASLVPHTAKSRGAKIIEINVDKSNYTDTITDIFLQGKASIIMNKLEDLIT